VIVYTTHLLPIPLFFIRLPTSKLQNRAVDRNEFADAFKNVKLPGFVWPDPDDSSDLRIVKDVVEYGCHIVAIQKEVGHPELAYSIGLYLNYQQPEIMIVEMDRAAAGSAINRISAHLKKGERLDCGIPYKGFHDKVPLMFRPLRMEDYTDELGFAIWFYCSKSGGLSFPVYQAMWPDRAGRFPSDPQCYSRVVQAQALKKNNSDLSPG